MRICPHLTTLSVLLMGTFLLAQQDTISLDLSFGLVRNGATATSWRSPRNGRQPGDHPTVPTDAKRGMESVRFPARCAGHSDVWRTCRSDPRHHRRERGLVGMEFGWRYADHGGPAGNQIRRRTRGGSRQLVQPGPLPRWHPLGPEGRRPHEGQHHRRPHLGRVKPDPAHHGLPQGNDWRASPVESPHFRPRQRHGTLGPDRRLHHPVHVGVQRMVGLRGLSATMGRRGDRQHGHCRRRTERRPATGGAPASIC